MDNQQKHETVNTGVHTVIRSVEDVIDKGYRPEFRQFNRKNNVKVAHLYSLYLQGYSLQYIADVIYQHRFSRKSLFDVFKVRGYKLRSKKISIPKIYKGMKFYKDSDGLYRHRHGKTTVYLHKLIWEEVNGKLPAGYYVLFKDRNKENITVDNLEAIPGTQAKKLYYNNRNQHGYQRFINKGAWGL